MVSLCRPGPAEVVHYDHRMGNNYDLSCLRQSMGIGDQLPPDRLDALMTRDGFEYIDIFGQTETS